MDDEDCYSAVDEEEGEWEGGIDWQPAAMDEEDDCPTPAPASASAASRSASASAPRLLRSSSPAARKSPRLQQAAAAASASAAAGGAPGSVLRGAGSTPRGAASRTPRSGTPSASSALLRLAGFTSPPIA